MTSVEPGAGRVARSAAPHEGHDIVDLCDDSSEDEEDESDLSLKQPSESPKTPPPAAAAMSRGRPRGPGITDIPTRALVRILLGSSRTDNNLLHRGAVCACVCREWRDLVRESPAMMMSILDFTERRSSCFRIARRRHTLMKCISDALDAVPRTDGKLLSTLREQKSCCLELRDVHIGDFGAKALGAALEVHPVPIAEINLSHDITEAFGTDHMWQSDQRNLTDTGLRAVLSGCHPGGDLSRVPLSGGLCALSVSGNLRIGDAGIIALAQSMLPALEVLHIGATGCGDDGLTQLSEALRGTGSIKVLCCEANANITASGWQSLSKALPDLKLLRILDVQCCGGMRDEGAAALADGLALAESLEVLNVVGCRIGAENEVFALLLFSLMETPPSAKTDSGQLDVEKLKRRGVSLFSVPQDWTARAHWRERSRRCRACWT